MSSQRPLTFDYMAQPLIDCLPKGLTMAQIALAIGVLISKIGARVTVTYFFSRGVILRLFQHTFGTHTEQPLPTGYKLKGFLS